MGGRLRSARDADRRAALPRAPLRRLRLRARDAPQLQRRRPRPRVVPLAPTRGGPVACSPLPRHPLRRLLPPPPAPASCPRLPACPPDRRHLSVTCFFRFRLLGSPDSASPADRPLLARCACYPHFARWPCYPPALISTLAAAFAHPRARAAAASGPPRCPPLPPCLPQRGVQAKVATARGAGRGGWAGRAGQVPRSHLTLEPLRSRRAWRGGGGVGKRDRGAAPPRPTRAHSRRGLAPPSALRCPAPRP